MPLAYNPALTMPILDEHSLDFISHGPEQTQRLGVRLGELLRPGDVICLAGDLGSGKTTLAQGIAPRLGSGRSCHQPDLRLDQRIPARRTPHDCFTWMPSG